MTRKTRRQQPPPSKHPHLSLAVSLAIAEWYRQGSTAEVLAVEFGVSRTTVLRHVHMRCPGCIRPRGRKPRLLS